jgi:hypothetical protein
MKSIKLFPIIFSLASCFFYSSLNGQVFLNGSFEKNISKQSCGYNLTNTHINSQMQSTYAFGKYEAIDILISGCIIDSIPEGNFALGIANEPSTPLNGEAVSLELSSPLIIGSTYQISFKVRSITKYGPQGNMELGSSSSKNDFGKHIATATTVADKWTTITFDFYAENDDQYITIMPVTGIKSWNVVDDFTIKMIE